jgi:transcriptional regulator with XRE-family HTH domain
MITGAKLKIIRNIKGITQKELAQLCDLSTNAVNAFEKGNTSMKSANIVKMCEAMNVSITYVVNDIEIAGP